MNIFKYPTYNSQEFSRGNKHTSHCMLYDILIIICRVDFPFLLCNSGQVVCFSTLHAARTFDFPARLLAWKNQWMSHKTTCSTAAETEIVQRPPTSWWHFISFQNTKTEISFTSHTKWNLHVTSHERKKQLFTCSLFMVGSFLVIFHPPTSTRYLIWKQAEKPWGISEIVQHFSSSSSTLPQSRRMYSLTRIHFSTNFSQFSHSAPLTHVFLFVENETSQRTRKAQAWKVHHHQNEKKLHRNEYVIFSFLLFHIIFSTWFSM